MNLRSLWGMNVMKTLRHKKRGAWGPPHWGPHVSWSLDITAEGTPGRLMKRMLWVEGIASAEVLGLDS